jgi:hypothetical protein
MKSHTPFVVALALLLLVACAPERLDVIELGPSTLSRQLLAHWSFDEGSGSVVFDDSENGRDGQLAGGTWLGDGQFGGALHLASGELVTVASFPDITSSFTASAWVRLTQYSEQPVNGAEWTTVVSTETSGGWELNVDHLDPEPGLHFGFYKGPNTTDYVSHTCGGLRLGSWTHIVGVLELTPASAANTFSMYLNGQKCFSMATAEAVKPGSSQLTIGTWPKGGRFLDGDVDDIAVWSRALVEAEVAALHRAAVSAR